MICDRLLRLECLRLAMRGAPSDNALERARAYSDFVVGSAPSADMGADPLGQFLADCAVVDAEAHVPSAHFYERFLAWCRATGAREWTPKGVSKAMLDKGFDKRSTENGLQWIGIRLADEVSQ
ncbi:hypothetical protein FIM10_02015 [Sphingomonadales bacterium 56]|uniref:primase-like DNA-binding domain-containing protein n=1 Tax=Sphingobium sp. S6 TaxID=2758386 RepID=UPI00191B772D|nr:primase-like DNA-binding domain-containing protein [Sphingobium sp. S6]MBY2927457.1 hypothetical protein [Sphingomonadales bacterium 56]CAD7335262.1 hypothetical protein SPHS6_00410 [Sphingobium sp. S6]